MGVYTFKELEKLLPSIASIAQQQVREYLQSLVDESLIRCEKIGSGNWYWCFLSDAKKGAENAVKALQDEEKRLREEIERVEVMIEEMKGREEEEDGLLEGGLGRKELMGAHEDLVGERGDLDESLALYADCDPAEVVRKMEETSGMKEGALRWTDNIESLASYLYGLVGREQAAGAMMQACGDEYVVGEGLKDLVDP